jgi:F-type H+-transporting ATPase subunit gamma
MSDTVAGLRRKIGRAHDLQSVVRTMKALASASIVQFERASRALAQYARTVELGLVACLRSEATATRGAGDTGAAGPAAMGVVVFGSDQGLVGPFNDVVAERTHRLLADAGVPAVVWAVGERVRDRLADGGVTVEAVLPVPGTIRAITPLVGRLLLASEEARAAGRIGSLHLCWCRPGEEATYQVTAQPLLPLDRRWQARLATQPWPTGSLPEVPGPPGAALRALVRELLFVSLFRAAADSLAAENASRLAAMQRADRNIDDLLAAFTAAYHRARQDGIDAELFDVVSGFEAARDERPPGPARRPGAAALSSSPP